MKAITPNLTQLEKDDIRIASGTQSQAVASVIFQSEPIPGSSGKAIVEYSTIKLTQDTDKLVFHIHPLSLDENLRISGAVNRFCYARLQDAYLRVEASASPVIRSGWDLVVLDVPSHLTVLVLRSLLDVITTALRD